MHARQITFLVCSFSAGSALFGLCSQAHGGGRGGDLPCYYEPTVVFGPPCPGNPNVFHGLVPQAINSAGQIAGFYGGCLGGPDTAMLWTAEQGILALPEPPQTFQSKALDITEVTGMKDFGHLCGSIEIRGLSGPRGFLFDWKELTLLGPLTGDPTTFATALNDQGTAVGASTGSLSGQHVAVSWNGEQAEVIAGLLGPHSEATDINGAGEITGWMGDGVCADCITHGFLWQDGEVSDLGFLPGSIGTPPAAISNTRQIVGLAVYPDREHLLVGYPFTWKDGLLTTLPLLPGATNGKASDVNDDGLIVGHCFDFGGGTFPNTAVLWRDGTVYNLLDMISQDGSITGLGLAWAVNNDGIIAANGSVIIDNTSHGVMVLLTPVYPVIGDLNCDEVVNAVDLSMLLTQWGPGEDLSADFNGNGSVGPLDLAQLLANWGSL